MCGADVRSRGHGRDVGGERDEDAGRGGLHVEHAHRADELGAEHLALRGGERDQDGVVLVAAVGGTALASWLRSASPAMMFIELLAEPVLEPLRRVLPRVGGLDLSALALIVILQILEIVLHHFSRAVLL